MRELTFDLQRFADAGVDFTDDEKTAIKNSSLPHLRMISNVAKNPIFTGFIDLLEQNKYSLEKIDKYVSPMFTLIGAFSKKKFGKDGLITLAQEAALFSSTVKIIDSILDVYDNLAGADADAVDKELGDIIVETSKMCGTISKLRDKDDDGILMPIVTASLSYGLTVVASIEELKPDKQEAINKALVKLGGATIKGFLKEIMQDSTAFTAPFGIADFGISVFVGILEGMSRNSDKIDYYSDDGLPEDIVRKEAMMDAIASGLKETLHTYLKGTDDIASYTGQILAQGCKWLGHLFAGEIDSYQFSMLEMNYMETIREIAKKGEYSSSSYSDIITVASSGTNVYAQDGNDYIENEFSNVTIFAGHGNDMVSSYGGAKYNSIHGGNGKDNLYITNSYSTIDGGKDDDFIFVYQGKNSINGSDGSDIILVRGEANTVNGGASDDFFDLTDSTKTIIDYTQGDGQDVIYGYNTNHVIKIKGDYSTVISGEDVIIQVGDGGIIVDSAKDLKVNINTIELEEGETLPTAQGAFISNPYDNAIILTPGLWGTEKALRGTNSNDYIENTLDNILIYGLSGNDTIINYGKNVTINAGAGNDYVENYGATVKINGGDDNDYIYNEAARVTITGANGYDTIENTGNYSRIDGGDDMDSIKNSGENTDINSGYGNDRIFNLASNARISGYDDINYISNTKNNVTIDGGEDSSTIYNSGNNVSINAGGGDNSISIDGSADGYQTVTADDGNNTLQVGERDETEEKRYYNEIYAGDGNNYINNSNVELSDIIAGAGNDTIITGGGEGWSWNYANHHTSIIAGAGNNQITVNSSMTYGKITAGNGNDLVSISGDGNSNIISVGEGRNTIFTHHYYDTNYNQYNTIEAGTGSDLIYTSGNSSFINVSSGRNLISLAGGYYNTLVTGKGDDTISLAADTNNNVIIFGGGNDIVYGYNSGDTVKSVGELTARTVGTDVILTDGTSKMTLKGAKGKIINTATLSSNDNIYKILVADKTVGDSVLPITIIPNPKTSPVDIFNKTGSTLVTGTAYDDTISNTGNKVTINALAGNDYIDNTGTNASINTGNGDDTVDNQGAKITIVGGKGDDYVDNYGKNVSINGGANNDDLNNYGNKATILADAGNDIIHNWGDDNGYGSDVSINGGAGNDSIVNNGGEDVTISGGKGNDSIINSGANVVFNYTKGDGDDTISGFNATSTLSISGSTYSTAKSGSDVVVTVGSNKITLVGAASLSKTNVVTADPTLQTLNDKSANAITLATAIKTADASKRTKSIKIVGNALANILTGGAGADTLSGGAGADKIVGNAGNDSLVGGDDNDSINGGDGNDKLFGNAGNDSLVGGNGDDTISGDSGNDRLFGQNGNDSIGGGEGADSLNGGDGSDKLFGGADNDSILGGNGEDSISGDAGDDKLFGNASNDSIDGGKGADTLSGDTGDDKLLGDAGNDSLNGGNGEDTLTGGSGNDILIGGKGNDIFIYSAGNDTVTDYAAGDKISLGAAISKTTLNDSDVVFTIGKGSLTIQKAKDKNISLINSKGKEYSTLVSDLFTVNNSTKSPATIESFVKTVDASSRTKVIAITGNALANTISGGTKNDSIFGAAGNDSILGNTGNDNLYGDAGNDILLGGNGNDSLWGGAGNDSLTGNDGNDIFIYSAGKDFISDYTAGQDKIQIAGGKISKTSLSGSDVFFTIGKGSLTVKNAKGKTISLLDSSNKASSTVVGAQALTNSNKANVTIAADMGAVDASVRTKAIAITGNALANTICGGTKNDSIFGVAGNDSIFGNAGNDKLYGDAGNDILLGGKGNDSLWGGTGNDSLWGDAGKDTFIYTANEGTDRIFDYEVGDMLKILNADGSDGSFKSSKYSGGNLTLSINGGGKIIFDDIASNTKFNINGSSYNISGSKLVKK